MKKNCKTPGAWFSFNIEEAGALNATRRITIRMDMPRETVVNKTLAKKIEKQTHDLLEEMLAPVWTLPQRKTP